MEKRKVKCDRCRSVTSIITSINNVNDAINSMRSKGMITDYLEDGLFTLESKKLDLVSEKCVCVWVEQGELPLSNTGVKISAFSEGIAQKAQK